MFHSLILKYLVSRAIFYFITAVSQSDVGADTDLMCDFCLPLIPWHRISGKAINTMLSETNLSLLTLRYNDAAKCHKL